MPSIISVAKIAHKPHVFQYVNGLDNTNLELILRMLRKMNKINVAYCTKLMQ